MGHTEKPSVKTFVKWLLIAFAVGLVFGWIRYWIGYYILLQGIIAGLMIPWAIHNTKGGDAKILSDASFKLSVLLFFMFMIGQAVGFGLAQPWFDPMGWLARVMDGKTSESVFGIFSTGGVVHDFYSNGLNGGFWLFLSLFDMAFMFFFLLIYLPPKTIKKKQ